MLARSVHKARVSTLWFVETLINSSIQNDVTLNLPTLPEDESYDGAHRFEANPS